MLRMPPLFPMIVLAAVASCGAAACATPKCAPASPDVAIAGAAPMPPAATPAGAAAPTAHPPSVDDMSKVAATLERFHAAAASADEEGYFALFADGGVFMGTDAKERWTVPQFRAYAHPRFATGKAWSFRSVYREIAVRGDTAWFDESLDTPNLGPARGSGVLVRDTKGDWKIVQYNLSVPIPNERFAEVKRTIEGRPAPATTPAPPAAQPPAQKRTPAPPGDIVNPSDRPAPTRLDPPVCATARAARARNSPAAANLDAQCRAAGGTP